MKLNTKVSHWIWQVKDAIDLFDEVLNWDSLLQSVRHGNISNLCGRKCNFSLKLTAPYHWTVCIPNNKAVLDRTQSAFSESATFQPPAKSASA